MLTRATSAIRLRALSSFLRQVRPSSSSGKSSDISILPDEEEGQDDFVEVPTKRRMGEPLYHNRDDFWSRYPQVNPAAARETWVEDLSTVGDDNSNELLRLHPDVWSIRPRLDIIYSNVEWQKWYKKVDYEYVKDRYEMDYFSRRRPWPQKGMGKARHATSTSPIWIQGGKAHGNKGPKSYFHMKNYSLRVWGLIHTLSAKYAQDDVKIVKDLEIPSDDPKYIEDLIDKRGWALSTLFVDKKDEFPRNLTAATMTIMHVNLMPAYGLNVHDMLKHKTLVLTKAAVEHIEEKLLFAQRRLDIADKCDSANTTSKKGVEMPYHGSGTLS